MKSSEAWLREWVDPPLSIQALADRLTMGGLEVDSITPAAPAFSDVVVARVIDIAPHPNAERLAVCRVDDGGDQPLQVVCGAPNVRPDMLAPFARIGAVLPDNTTIETTTVRGVESFGMLCSARELGLAETLTELMTLPADAPVGQSVRDYLRFDDTVLDIDLTPNRADCLSVAGIAREIATLTDQPLQTPAISPIEAVIDDRFAIDIESPEDCPRYVGRVIRSITPDMVTPLWLQERLRRGGLRSINPVVDVTNYVMLELGQPMHAFDLSKLRGGIRVRCARGSESFTLLDGQRIVPTAGTLLITDHAEPLALAGIVGGQDSAVDAATRAVFLESAFFTPQIISGKARAYGLSTDSSHRFERGVDPDLQARAMERATQLLLDIVGGKPGPTTDIAHPEYVPSRPVIGLRPARVERLLGTAIGTARIVSILRSLRCQVEEQNGSLAVIPPTFRFDLRIEADLIEEVARIYGYDRFPKTIHSFGPVMRREPQASASLKRLRTLLVDRGYQEAITYSFIDAALSRLFSPEQRARRVTNPISAELAVMRGSLWPGLINAAQYNLNRQQTRIRLFETGLQFVDSENGLQQTAMLAAIAIGSALPEQWGAAPREVDFYDIKGDVEALLSLASTDGQLEFRSEFHPALHAGQAARIVHDGKGIGRLGALHPAVIQSLGLTRRAFVFELELEALDYGRARWYRELSKFPAIRRDIAIVVDESVTAAQVRECIVSVGEDRLQDVYIFDIYRGEGVADDRKSLALGLILQDLTRTLHDEEVGAIVARIIARLTCTLGASLRM
jgi:phenylalanyl-tRNA synthetase beta chain